MKNRQWEVSVYFQIDNFWVFFQNVINTGGLIAFCHCLRLARGNVEMLESPAECESLSNYELVFEICMCIYMFIEECPPLTCFHAIF